MALCVGFSIALISLKECAIVDLNSNDYDIVISLSSFLFRLVLRVIKESSIIFDFGRFEVIFETEIFFIDDFSCIKSIMSSSF